MQSVLADGTEPLLFSGHTTAQSSQGPGQRVVLYRKQAEREPIVRAQRVKVGYWEPLVPTNNHMQHMA